nr:uncharacterized protein LOC117605315 isoform X2 [Osmia lignaria]
MEVEKRDGATRSAVLGTRKLPACLFACRLPACLLASHPKFPSRRFFKQTMSRFVDERRHPVDEQQPTNVKKKEQDEDDFKLEASPFSYKLTSHRLEGFVFYKFL